MLSVLCSAAMLCGAPMSAEAHELQLYCSNHNVWLRAEPSATTESERICIIPEGTVISVSEEYFGWGKTVCTIDGQTYTGWTALYLYSPISIEEMQPVSDDLVYSEYGVSGSRTALYQYLVNTMGFSAENALDLFRRLDEVNASAATATSYPAGVESSDVKKQVYDFLTDHLGFNRAAACAVMANIEAESGFRAYRESTNTNGLTSIGLFQWNGPRCEAFKAYCNANVLEYGSVDAQLAFLEYELNSSYTASYQDMLNCEDSADGAYKAAYDWASNFEVCARYLRQSRADAAYQLYMS